ncbi:MAG TPA: DUF72 domain-containing protein [Polyangiaceae bacterium]|nr:DUF72 domain-containing protein [Polyangiaceae bacterium]
MQAPSSFHVGRPTIEGAIARYARSFDLLEVVGEPGRHPRRPGLLEWRRVVPERFVFSVVVPAAVAALEHRPDRAESLSHARMVADALAAGWWLVRTPPSVTPSARAGRELEALMSELGDERKIAWEPRGVWSEEEARRTAEQLRVYLVRDLSREERGDDRPIVYTRLRALGEGARIGAAAAERLGERLEGASDSYVVVEGAGAGRVRQVLRDLAGLPSDEADEELRGPDDEADDEDFSDEDGDLEEDDSDLEDE